MKGFKKLLALMLIAALIGGVIPVTATAADENSLSEIGLGTLDEKGVTVALGESEYLNLNNLTTGEYKFSLNSDTYVNLENENLSGVRNGTTDLQIFGRALGNSSILTISHDSKDYKIPISVLPRLSVKSDTIPTQSPNSDYTMKLTFEVYDGEGLKNITADMVYGKDYTVSTKTPDYATINSSTPGIWNIHTGSAGTAVIEVKTTNSVGAKDITKTFNFAVANPSSSTTTTTASEDISYIGLGTQYKNGISIGVGEYVDINLKNLTSYFHPNEEYSFSLSSDEHVRLGNANQSGVKKGSTDLRVHGRAITEGSTTILTITLNSKNYEIPISVVKRLEITSGTTLTQMPNTNFAMNLKFEIFNGKTRENITNRMTYRQDYDVYSNSPNIATIAENTQGTTWRIETKAVGTAVIEVVAKDPSGEALDVTKTFSIVVSNAAANTNSSNTTNTTDSSNTTTTTTPATTAPAQAPAEEQYSSSEFTGDVTVDGAKFYTSNDFSAGTAFSIRPENDGGDWWRSPAAFTGARGAYTATGAGVFALTYCDTDGKTYPFMVNTYKRVEKNKFMVPERVPLGAIFAIKSPEGAGRGIWGKDPNFLSGNKGTYIPVKAGKTIVTFTTTKFRYTLYLDIVDDTPPAETAPGADAPPPANTSPANTPPAETPAQPAAPPPSGITLQSIVPRGRIVLH